jgi:hypothetical protein
VQILNYSSDEHNQEKDQEQKLFGYVHHYEQDMIILEAMKINDWRQLIRVDEYFHAIDEFLQNSLKKKKNYSLFDFSTKQTSFSSCAHSSNSITSCNNHAKP